MFGLKDPKLITRPVTEADIRRAWLDAIYGRGGMAMVTAMIAARKENIPLALPLKSGARWE